MITINRPEGFELDHELIKCGKPFFEDLAAKCYKQSVIKKVIEKSLINRASDVERS